MTARSADKVAKVRELLTGASSTTTGASLALIENLLADDPLMHHPRFELEALGTLPPRTPGALPVSTPARTPAPVGTPPTPRA